jgi:hypothetical protein
MLLKESINPTAGQPRALINTSKYTIPPRLSNNIAELANKPERKREIFGFFVPWYEEKYFNKITNDADK